MKKDTLGPGAHPGGRSGMQDTRGVRAPEWARARVHGCAWGCARGDRARACDRRRRWGTCAGSAPRWRPRGAGRVRTGATPSLAPPPHVTPRKS